jgi:L-serine/L-threonine ammonia-lyase
VPTITGISARVIAVETHGAQTLYNSYQVNKDPNHVLPSDAVVTQPERDGPRNVTLAAIKTRARTLGARFVAYDVLKQALSHPGGVIPVSIRDEDAMQAALAFAG